jgi:hypothetical protein
MNKKNTGRIRPKQTLSNRLKKDEWETVEDYEVKIFIIP